MKINSARFGAVSLGAVLLVATAPAALADTAFLSYTLQDSSLVTATFTGTLAGDLFTVTSTDALAFNGFSYNPADFPFVDSVDEFIGFGSDVPILSLSGTYLDFIVATPSVTDGFLLAVGNDVAIPVFGGPAFRSSSAFGGTTEPFVLDNYSLTVVTSSVPEASTWDAGGALLLAAGGTWVRSRRQA